MCTHANLNKVDEGVTVCVIVCTHVCVNLYKVDECVRVCERAYARMCV